MEQDQLKKMTAANAELSSYLTKQSALELQTAQVYSSLLASNMTHTLVSLHKRLCYPFLQACPVPVTGVERITDMPK